MKSYIIRVILASSVILSYMYAEPFPQYVTTFPIIQSAEAAQDGEVSQHSPYSNKMCAVCHSSENPGKTDLTAETPDLCYTCHAKHSAKAFLHSPVSIGECLVCHNPHESQYRALLQEKIPELCYLCHVRMEGIMADEQKIKHEPAIDNCTACHDAHASDVNNIFLKSDMKTLCTECHIEADIPMENYIADATFKHKPVEEEERCANCHTAHASPFEFHLIAEPMDLCMKCHNQEVTAYDGKVLTNMAELFDQHPIQHGPIRSKSCSGCHSPHGSDYFRILINAYPENFYTEEFSPDTYKLCFSCHESTILQDKETTTLTNFRDGPQNLHFLHVNRAKKGRTCRACHETHASTHPKHIRDAVPFGKINWPLELQYQIEYADINTGEPCDSPGETCERSGGSCVACHSRQSYNYRKGTL